MPRNRSIQTPIRKIKEALDELVQIIQQDTRRRAAAETKRTSGRGRSAKANGSPRGRAIGRQPSVDRDKLLSLIRSKKAGVGAADLASAMRVDSTVLSYHLKQLRNAKKIRSTGRTSQMRYFAS